MGMNAKVAPGFVIVRGHAVHSTAVETLPIRAADQGARTDRIVLRLDPAANSIALAVLDGTAADGSPALTQTDTGVYEIPPRHGRCGFPGHHDQGLGRQRQPPVRRYARGRLVAIHPSRLPASGHSRLQPEQRCTRVLERCRMDDAGPGCHVVKHGRQAGTFTPSPHTHAWSEIMNPPATMPPTAHGHAWSETIGTPSAYPPASHAHSWSDISGKPSPYPLGLPLALAVCRVRRHRGLGQRHAPGPQLPGGRLRDVLRGVGRWRRRFRPQHVLTPVQEERPRADLVPRDVSRFGLAHTTDATSRSRTAPP